ncbi:MAG TPA: FecR domain-containing protein, partial [Gemmatimonadaceae bacterium]|nr:FecR domain-containing protein [Gemmatimonadaceae bacterium]
MSPSHHPIDWELLQRYHAGEATPAESDQARQWLAAYPQAQALLQAFDRVVHLPAASTEWLDLEHAYAALHKQLWHRGQGIAWTADIRSPAAKAQDRDVYTVPVGRTRIRSDRFVRHLLPSGGFKAQPLRWGVLCTIVALAVLSWVVGVPHGGWRRAPSVLAYTTGNGERATITLPDGGTVALNVASRLEVPMDYTAGDRSVRLVGEGVFTVPQRQRSPFTVVAGGTVAR